MYTEKYGTLFDEKKDMLRKNIDIIMKTLGVKDSAFRLRFGISIFLLVGKLVFTYSVVCHSQSLFGVDSNFCSERIGRKIPRLCKYNITLPMIS